MCVVSLRSLLATHSWLFMVGKWTPLTKFGGRLSHESALGKIFKDQNLGFWFAKIKIIFFLWICLYDESISAIKRIISLGDHPLNVTHFSWEKEKKIELIVFGFDF